MLPLVIPDANDSPYQSPSAFATDPRLLPRRDEPVNQSDFEEYCVKHAQWLDDFALFQVIKRRYGQQSWVDWPDPWRHRDTRALRTTREQAGAEILQIMQQQYRLIGHGPGSADMPVIWASSCSATSRSSLPMTAPTPGRGRRTFCSTTTASRPM